MRIVPARDGGLARLRLAGGVLSAEAARAITVAAARCGSGIVEVTNRANLQLRGIRDDAHAELIAIALDAGLGPAFEGGDLRNVMLSPLASDATRALAADIVNAIQADAALHALSPKFALQLDDGEALAMLAHPQDLWLSAIDGGAHFVFGFAGSPGGACGPNAAHGSIARADAQRFVFGVLHAFAALASPDEHRMRDLLPRIGIALLMRSLDVPLAPTPSEWRRASSDATLRLGVHEEAHRATAYAGAQPTLGRLDATTLAALADLASTYAQGRLVMTPWQSVLMPDIDPAHAPAVLARMNALGLATEPGAPFACLIACAGSTGCTKSHADTKKDAHRLARLLEDQAGATSVHLSGCARSCAAAHPVDVTLLAVAPGRYDLYRHVRLDARDLTLEEAAERLARSHADV